MKKTILMIVAAASCHLSAVADEVKTYEENKISDAYGVMSTEYTKFAKMFNVCTKQKELPECGKPYDSARSDYERAKNNYEVLKMANTDAFSGLEAPSASYSDIAKNLVTLGFMTIKNEKDIPFESLVEAVNRWQKSEGQPETENISMFVMQAINVEASKVSSKG